MSSTSAVAVLAQGLRELRDFAEGPDGEELRERTGLTTEQIDAALGGERLPTREVTLALVEAWEGDVEAWREYWGQIEELAGEQEPSTNADADASTNAQTPAPPEPSIITPVPAREPGSESEVGAGKDAVTENDSDAQEAKAARAQLATRVAVAKAEADAKAAVQKEGQPESAAPEPAAEPAAAEPAAAEESHAEEAPAQSATEAARAADAGPAKATPADAQAAEAKSAGEKAKSAVPVLEGVVVPGAGARPAKKVPLARVGIPILLFAIGVGVGAFGDHALNSKQASTDSAASVPLVSKGSSSPSRSRSSSPSPTATSSSVNPTASVTPTGSSSSTVTPGTVLGTYVGIQLASGYSINFLSDPYHPAAGTANGPDTMGFFASSFVDGRFYANRVAILDPTDTGSYSSCLNDTRYQHDVLLSQVEANSSFCITTDTGHLVLVTLRRIPSSTDANPYAVLDVTVWQGPPM